MSPLLIKGKLENFATPGGVLDQTFDRFGKSYSMLALHIPQSNAVSIEETQRFNPSCS